MEKDPNPSDLDSVLAKPQILFSGCLNKQAPLTALRPLPRYQERFFRLENFPDQAVLTYHSPKVLDSRGTIVLANYTLDVCSSAIYSDYSYISLTPIPSNSNPRVYWMGGSSKDIAQWKEHLERFVHQQDDVESNNTPTENLSAETNSLGGDQNAKRDRLLVAEGLEAKNPAPFHPVEAPLPNTTMLFGTELTSRVAFEQQKQNSTLPIPLMLYDILIFVDKNIRSQGVWRETGSFSTIAALRAMYESGVAPDLEQLGNVNAVTGLFKLYAKVLPQGIVPADSVEQILQNPSVAACQVVVSKLPRVNSQLAYLLLKLFRKVVLYSSENLMNLEAVAKAVGLSLISEELRANLSIIVHFNKTAEFLIREVDKIWHQEVRQQRVFPLQRLKRPQQVRVDVDAWRETNLSPKSWLDALGEFLGYRSSMEKPVWLVEAIK